MKTWQDMLAAIGRMNLTFEPVELQKLDAYNAYQAGSYGLFYDVGGGKTFVGTLVALLHNLPSVVVCPHILIPQWKAWLESVGETDIGIYYGPKRKLESFDSKWVLTSHRIYTKDLPKFRPKLKRKDFVQLVDEAQNLKNTDSLLFKAVRELSFPDKPVLLMTATPTTKPEDTYSYMKIKSPALYKSFGQWCNLHVAARDPVYDGITEYKNLELLAENFAINAVKRDKVELFGHNLQPIYDAIRYELSPAHKKLYTKLVEEQLLLLPNGDKIDGTTANRLRHLLQQIIWNYGHFSGNDTDISAGFELLEQVCEEVNFMPENRTKFVVWTYYQMSSRSIHKWLADKFGAATGCGAYGGVDSAKAVQQIMFDPKVRWMVAHPMSVGAGLNLHHVCHEMAFAEMSTVPMHSRQAIGRVDRAGQKVRPTIRMLQALGTLQMQMFDNLLRNDDRVTQVERTRNSLRQELLGEVS